MSDTGEAHVYVADWSRGPTMFGIVFFGGIAGVLAINAVLAGQIISGLCAIAVVIALSKLSLMSASAKYVAVTPTNLEIGKGIWTHEEKTIPLEKIDKIIVNSGSVRVSAGSLLNQTNLFVRNPKLLAERLEKARREIGHRSQVPSPDNRTVTAPTSTKTKAGKKAAPPTKEQNTATLLATGIIVATILGFSRCSVEPRQSACSTYAGDRRLICEKMANECLKDNNMISKQVCRAMFPNGY